HGSYMPADWTKVLQPFQTIYFGAVGWPTVPDHISLWGLLLPIRKAFDQYANVRPVRLLPGLRGRLVGKGAEHIDFVCVRENTEGEYSGVGGRVHRGTPHEVAIQDIVFTRMGTEDIAGKGIANPLGTIWAGQMMLDFLGETEAARLLMQAIEAVTQAGTVLTPDLGGTAATGQVTDAVIAALTHAGR
ncbi:MAG: hypothetical protein EBU40_09865, partial [Proteobacteria bacterium]|nr:hypothetical protein [Pseudomonadota bacterium]